MDTSVVGRVRNTKLYPTSGLMPLFEAVMNSVQAIDSARTKRGEIRIRIERSQQVGLELHGNALPDILEFSVTDNGCGFTEENYRSFNTMDSLQKASIGGKGVGRLIWLKAFERASVESTFSEGDHWRKRSFSFTPTADGVENHNIADLNGNNKREHKTTVRLIGFRSRYRDQVEKSAEAIGRRLVEHCLQRYVLGAMPHVTIYDPTRKDRVDLTTLYQNEFHPQSHERSFSVEGETFHVIDILLRSTTADHRVHFCAHQRVVRSKALKESIPFTELPFADDAGNQVVYWGCVTGKLLDDRVDAERTNFDIDDDPTLWSDGMTWPKIEDAAMKLISEYVAPRTADAKKASQERVRRYIEQQPKYRPLLGHRSRELERLSPTLTDEKLDAEMYRLMNSIRQELRQKVQSSLADNPTDTSLFEEHHEKFVAVLGELQEVQKSDLADYVVNRASVLRFFEEMLKKTEGRFENEDSLHQLFFPRRTTSDLVDFDQHNLWVLDERLAFHQYLASDQPFEAQIGAPIQVPGKDRPDILIYNLPHAFSPSDQPYGSVVIVEFKKPERNDYTDTDNPILQVIEYAEQIRSGKAKRADGGSMDPVPDDTPFYCYVVATLTPKLRLEAERRDFIEAPDRLGFFTFNKKLRAYIEVSSYRKVLDDARKRNKAFFDQLQIDTSMR